MRKYVRPNITELLYKYKLTLGDINTSLRTPGLKEKTELLKSLTAIGDITSKILLCELHLEDGRARISAKAQTAHAGLAPEHRVSGSSVRGKPHICRVGNSRLRKCLYMPAMVAINHNPVISAFYKRLIGKGSLKW